MATGRCEIGINLFMGWLRLVGSLKLLVSFAEYSLYYRALLQKRPLILRSLLIVAIPYVCVYVGMSVMYVSKCTYGCIYKCMYHMCMYEHAYIDT